MVPGVLKPLRIGSGLLLCAAGALALVLLGRSGAAAGVGIGFGLYVLNVLLMAEIARSLLDAGPRRIRIATVLSSVGRLSLLGVGLAAVATLLGRETVLGACGGLLAAQVNLHAWGSRGKETG
jgi:hypothetical protein